MIAAVCAALACVSPALAADRVVERGIVQYLDASGLVLRALDGTEVRIPVGPATRFRLNGRSTTFDAIRSGFVAEAVTTRSGPAVVVRAFGRATAGEGNTPGERRPRVDDGSVGVEEEDQRQAYQADAPE